MVLSTAALLATRGLTSEQKQALADALGISIPTLYRYIDNNDDNLTKAAGLQFLRAATGLTDAELLKDNEQSKLAQS